MKTEGIVVTSLSILLLLCAGFVLEFIYLYNVAMFVLEKARSKKCTLYLEWKGV